MFWPGRDRAVIDRDQFRHLAVQHGAGADADFFRQREQKMAVDRQRYFGALHRARGRKHRRHAGLVVEMARGDEAGIGEFRLRVDRHHVADVDAERARFCDGAGSGIETDFEIGPGRRLGVDFLVISVAGGLQRQNGAAKLFGVAEHGDARAFGKARRPVSDRQWLQPPIGADVLDDGAERIEMADQRAARRRVLALQRRADGAAAGQFKGNTERVQFGADQRDDHVGHAGRARRAQQAFQECEEISLVDGQLFHQFDAASTLARLCGNRKSINFSAVGCGS